MQKTLVQKNSNSNFSYILSFAIEKIATKILERGFIFMNPKKMKFKSKTKNFYAEPAPGNTGIRFMQYNERGEECIAMIIDNDKEFLLTSKNRDGMYIQKVKLKLYLNFWDTAILLLQLKYMLPFLKNIKMRL